MSNFFFSHNVFYSIRNLYPHLSIFMTLFLYLLLNWKSPKLAYEVKDLTVKLNQIQLLFWFCVSMCMQNKSFEKTGRKGNIAHNELFLLCPLCSLPTLENFQSFSSNSNFLSSNSFSFQNCSLKKYQDSKILLRNLVLHAILSECLLSYNWLGKN